MPTEDVNPAAIFEAVKKIGILAELLEERNQNNLKMIAEGKVSGGKQIGPYARVLTFAPGETIMDQGQWGGNTFYFSTDSHLDVYVTLGDGSQRKAGRINPGSCFGEMSVLAGVPRNATVITPADGPPVTILEVVRPALRLLRSLKKFAEQVDSTYRDHGMHNTIVELQADAATGLAAEDLVALGLLGKFMAYGKHHVIAQEGEPIERLVLVRNGWIRRVRGVPIFLHTITESGPGIFIPEDFVGAGNCLGLDALTGQGTWQYSAASLARTEVFEIPLDSLRQDPPLTERVLKAFSAFSLATDDATLQARSQPPVLAAAEKEIATGIVDAVNLLVMDMDLCIRCGNCSLACHKVHGQSRLLRRGINIERPVTLTSTRTQHVLSPSVCMHCKDPECLTGCPTTAIFRAPGGHVDIDPVACIGCFDCATQCPYDAISMVPRTGTGAGGESDDMVAIKCNLCANTPLNPKGASRLAYSCEENCPTGALVRVNPHKYFDEIDQTLGLVFRDETHAIGRNIHKRDPLAIAWHAGGGFLTLLIAALLGVTALFFGFEAPLRGSWLNLRWITGLVGLGGVAIVMTYPLRKSIYRRRAGALRYWLLAHIYAGLLAGIVLLMHGASHGGGLLTATLMISFDLVILTGLFGLLCYLVVPRIMTSIEGEPLLIEDLQGRAAELRAELATLTNTSSAEIKQLMTRIRKQFSSFSFLLRQYLQREPLSSLSAKGRLEFRNAIEACDKTQREPLLKMVDGSITLRRVESLIHLHRMLKLWVAPHVVSTSIMLVLLVAHIIQVVYFRVR